MTCATKRGVRRSTIAGKDKRHVLTLDAAVRELTDAKRGFRLQGRHIGRRVLAMISGGAGGVRTLGFRHPTKKATRGRCAFLHMQVGR